LAADGADITLFRLPGYLGCEPGQPVSREVVAVMSLRTEGTSDYWTVGFWVNDVNATVDRAVELRGSVPRPATGSAAGRSVVLADPAGAVFS
jgi:uncharacterized protein